MARFLVKGLFMFGRGRYGVMGLFCGAKVTEL